MKELKWKLQMKTTKQCRRKLKKIQINGYASCGHELEDLIQLKNLSYPKQYTDSEQSLSKFQWHFLQK